MDLWIDRDRLAAALDRADRIAAKAGSTLLRGEGSLLRVSTSDGDRFYSEEVPVTGDAEGAIAIPAAQLRKIVKAMPAGDLRLAVSGTTIEIRSGSSRQKMGGLEAETVAHWADIHKDAFDSTSIPVKRADLVWALGKVAYACWADSTRPSLAGVHLHPSADGSATTTLVATDGHRLATARLSGVCLGPVTVPTKTCEDVDRMLPEEETVQVALAPGRAIRFQCGAMALVSSVIDMGYPQVEPAFPKSFTSTAMVDAGELLRTIGRCELAAAAGPVARIAIKVEAGGDGLLLHAHDPVRGTEADEELPCETSGDSACLEAHPIYLTEAIRAMTGGKGLVTIRFGGYKDPVSLFSEDEGDRVIVMPMWDE